jgi:hypothetical protein
MMARPLRRRRGQQRGRLDAHGSRSLSLGIFFLAVVFMVLLAIYTYISVGLVHEIRGGDQSGKRKQMRRRHRHRQHNHDDNAKEASGTPRLPDILLIGAQKAGSSALANWLFDYGLCPARVFGREPRFYRKEVHFFGDRQRYSQGVDFYTSRFAHCPRDTLAIDATPATMLYADQVHKTYDEWEGGKMANGVKILAVLREPSARELSWYNHVTLKCRTDRSYNHTDCYNADGSMRSFSEYVHDVTLERVDIGSTRRKHLCRGLYAHLLGEWFAKFQRDQILILSYDEMVSDEERMMQRVQSFLGLDPEGNPGRMEKTNAKNNEQKVRSIDCNIQQELNGVFDPLNDDLYRLLETNPGPGVENRPFPRFVVTKKCTSPDRLQ